MKWINKTLLIVFIIFGVNGCSDKQIENSIFHAEIAISGYKAPKFFHFTAPQYVDRWYFEDKHYTALPPRTYQKDWIKMQGWKGAFINNTIVLSNDNKHIHGEGIDLGYGILFSCSVSKCTDREREIGNGTRKHPSQRRTPNGKIININVHTEYHGKEDYPCVVAESYEKRGVKAKAYSCYKFNPQKTMYKSVTLKLIYTKSSNLPAKYKHLAKEYTYQDLQRRAQRMLNSLYIKDGW